MTCHTCKYLDVGLNKAGRRVVYTQKAYRCLAPDPAEPKLPASVDVVLRSFLWPPRRSFMCPDMGKNCPCFEPIVGGKRK